jgi:hypothetical protein
MRVPSSNKFHVVMHLYNWRELRYLLGRDHHNGSSMTERKGVQPKHLLIKKVFRVIILLYDEYKSMFQNFNPTIFGCNVNIVPCGAQNMRF